MSKRMLSSGQLPNKREQRQNQEDETVIIQVQLEGKPRERFLAFKRRSEVEVSNAAAGKALILRGLDHVEANGSPA